MILLSRFMSEGLTIEGGILTKVGFSVGMIRQYGQT
jgi:hypothetical protein